MSQKCTKVMDFLLSRRSVSAQSLVSPIPSKPVIERLLLAAARTPDHGKLVPWRFLVIEQKSTPKLAKLILDIGNSHHLDADKLKKNANTFLNAPLIIAVIFSPKATDRIPLIEQKLSAGAACLALLNSALADGWGANWLTGWMSRDKDFLKKGLKLKNDEFVAGFIHIGTPKSTPLERERPNMGEITEWLT